MLQELTPIANILDLCEIIFITILTFFFIKWLATDSQKNLVYYFYGYCVSAFISHFCGLYALRYVLLNGAPVIAITFIALHQKALQKNYVMLKKDEPKLNETGWLDELIQTCLHALNHNKEFTCVIERDVAIKELVTESNIFNANLTKEILDIFLEKQFKSADFMLWINKTGKIMAINCTWKFEIEEQWISTDAKSLPKWKQDGLFITAKTDAIIFKIYPITRSFDFIINGKIIDTVSVKQAFEILQHSLYPKSKENKNIENISPSNRTALRREL